MNYIVYDKTGKILRSVQCPANQADSQIRGDELMLAGTADDLTQKIVHHQITDKTPEEIEAERPPEIPEAEKQAHITNGQYEDLLKRIAELENR